MIRVGGITTVIVAAGTVACGLLMLGGVGPAPAGTELAGESLPAAPLAAPGTEPTTTTTTIAATTTFAATTTTTTTITTTAPPPSPVPLSVAPATVTVGAGGVARISGTCPLVDGSPLGPVEIWEVGDSIRVIATGVTAAAWAYDWTAPLEIQPLLLQAWCGDPTGFAGGYPAALQISVVFVAQEPAPTTTAAGGGVAIPETG